MQATVQEIRSGAFAKEWSSDREGKLEVIRMAREMQKALPFTEWEDRTRRLFRIGDAAEPAVPAPAAAARRG
jgi:ketol-acid reductoisomerase